MKSWQHAIVFTLIFLLAGCASQQKIENINTPFERPKYTIYSPPEEGWHFLEYDSTGEHVLTFYKPQKERDHTLFATIQEVYTKAPFDTPEDFLKFYQTAQKLSADPRRFDIIEEVIKLDDTFGEFSLSYYSKAEDHAAHPRSDVPFLMTETYVYSIIHPNHDNLMINITYSERGVSGDINTKFKQHAMHFINSLKIKQ